jgi:hypothetical protein
MAKVWPLVALCLVLGLAAGVGAALLRPTTYTAAAKLSVGGTDLSAQSVPGFAVASAQLAANYARFVETAPVRAALPSDQAEALSTVSASPEPDSNVILLEATASTSGAAVAAAQLGADLLRSQVDDAVQGASSEEVLADYTEMSRRVAQAQQVQASAQSTYDRLRNPTDPDVTPSAAAVERASAAVAAASAQLDVLEVQQSALSTKYQNVVNEPVSQSRLTIVQPAAPSFDDSRSRLQRYGLAGLLLGFMLALLLAVLLDRRAAQRSTRRRVSVDEAEVAAVGAGLGDSTDVSTPAR